MNRSILITGATSGIGRAGAIELARRGHSISVIGRDKTKLDLLAEELGGRVALYQADLADLTQVRDVAEAIAAADQQIDVLVNNAGVAARGPRLTGDGFDEMLAANYLGPFLLTHLLLDRIRASAPSRIVVTGSEAHRMTGPFHPAHFEEMGSYSGMSAQLAYGRTKLLDILFANELARRLAPERITVNSFCPGLVNTSLVRDVRNADRVGTVMSKTPLVRTPEQGARMLVHLAADDDVQGITGRFWSSTPGARFIPAIGPRRNTAIARLVYDRTCELVGVAPVT
jgi:retinol dehydrogenase-12